MSTWVTLLCPTFFQSCFFLMLLSLIIFSIPSYSSPPFLPFLSRLWAFLLPQLTHYQLLLKEEVCDLLDKCTTYMKVFFSSALPENEETGFEEQFKYFIVTSSMLNDIAMQQTINAKNTTIPNLTNATNTSSRSTSTTASFPFLATEPKSLHLSYRYSSLTTHYLAMGTIATFSVILFTILTINFIGALCFHWPHPSYLPFVFIQFILLGSLFIVYRHLRHIRIRKNYEHLLQYLQQILHLTGICDRLMDQLIDKIRDVEAISQGYTLAPVNSVLEQPRTYKSRLILDMQVKSRSILVPYFDYLMTLLRQLAPLTHPVNLSTLRGMYNVKAPILENNVEEAGFTVDCSDKSNNGDMNRICMEQLDYLVYMIRSSRREWFMHLLALEMMTLGHDSARQDYESLLNSVKSMMMEMEYQTKLVTKNMKKALISDLFFDYLGDESITTSVTTATTTERKSTDQYSRVILNKLDLLEKHLRNLQTKIVLCRHDVKGLSHDKSTMYSFGRVSERFGSMDQDISYLLSQWDESKSSLFDIINGDRKSRSSLPSPPSSPSVTANSKGESTQRPLDAGVSSTPIATPSTSSTSFSSVSLSTCSTSSTSSITPTCISLLDTPQPPFSPSPSLPLSSAPAQSSLQMQSSLPQSPLPSQPSLPTQSPLPPPSSTFSYPPKPGSSKSLPAIQLASSATSPSTSTLDNASQSTDPRYHSLTVPTSNTNLSCRQSWITAAAIASFLESRRIYRLQTQQRQQEPSTESASQVMLPSLSTKNHIDSHQMSSD